MRLLPAPWRAAAALGTPLELLDTVVKSGAHHRILDEAIGLVRRVGPRNFFHDGWGPVTPSFFMEQLRAAAADVYTHGEAAIAPVHVTLGPRVQVHGGMATVQRGRFANVNQRDLLPPESHTAEFELITPTPSPAAAAPDLMRHSPIAIVLAATGEQGFARRRSLVGMPLAERGIASLILEGPFYGSRRPVNQSGCKLRHVSDLPVLGFATIDEARSLVRWLRHTGQYGPIVLTGSSMGGLHSAMAASLLPYDVGVVSWLGPPSAEPVFTYGSLAKSCAWDALAAVATDPRLEASLARVEALLDDVWRGLPSDTPRLQPSVPPLASNATPYAFARHQLSRFLHITDILAFPPPRRPDAAVFVAAHHDTYVPAQCIAPKWQAIQRLWPGCTVEWAMAGHVSGILFHRQPHANAVAHVAAHLAGCV